MFFQIQTRYKNTCKINDDKLLIIIRKDQKNRAIFLSITSFSVNNFDSNATYQVYTQINSLEQFSV